MVEPHDAVEKKCYNLCFCRLRWQAKFLFGHITLLLTEREDEDDTLVGFRDSFYYQAL